MGGQPKTKAFEKRGKEEAEEGSARKGMPGGTAPEIAPVLLFSRSLFARTL